MRDVAARTGTSVATVSATLNGKDSGSIRVGVETRRRILQVAAEMGYVPNEIARSLATGKTGVIGLVLPYAEAFADQNPFCNHIMHGVFQAAIEAKLNVMLFTAWQEGQAVDPTPWIARVDGVVAVMPTAAGSLVRTCRDRGLPITAVVAESVDDGYFVNSDDELGGYLATRHLLQLGHRRVALLSDAPSNPTSRPRRLGYLRAFEEAGIDVSPEVMVLAGSEQTGGKRGCNLLLALPQAKRPTAIVAANDLCAAGAISAIKDAGLRVPHDIAIVGYDDTEFAANTRPALTSVQMRIDELGAAAVRQLGLLIAGNEPVQSNVILPVTLTIRESCGASSAAPSL